ncbi:hypothetical protein, partial [Vibrio parahaemolyticus]|uniref:hypothetical protein n=1 Tax=Vibrio parahaemolyticus TaxID=670 RepID=UPI00301DEF17
FQAALTDEVVPPEDVDEQIRLTFRGPCPDCGREGGNDLYSATKLSAFLIFFQINSQKRLCCAGCGRKNRLLAALHC